MTFEEARKKLLERLQARMAQLVEVLKDPELVNPDFPLLRDGEEAVADLIKQILDLNEAEQRVLR